MDPATVTVPRATTVRTVTKSAPEVLPPPVTTTELALLKALARTVLMDGVEPIVVSLAPLDVALVIKSLANAMVTVVTDTVVMTVSPSVPEGPTTPATTAELVSLMEPALATVITPVTLVSCPAPSVLSLDSVKRSLVEALPPVSVRMDGLTNPNVMCPSA